MSINEKLIVPVFKELVQHKPKLAYFLPEDDEEIDIRQLGEQVINAFPYPIGEEIRPLFTPECSAVNQRRLYQILKLVERCVEFISFVLLSQLLEEQLTRNLSYPAQDFQRDFKRSFRMPMLGTYIWLIQSLEKIFTANGIEPFIPEMSVLLSKKFSSKLHSWRNIRNKIAHYQINLDEEEIQKQCMDFQEKLIEVLSNLCFLIKYPVVTSTGIQVNKPKRKPAGFIHAFTYLPDFADNKPREYDTCTDSRAVLLLKSLSIIESQDRLKNFRIIRKPRCKRINMFYPL